MKRSGDNFVLEDEAKPHRREDQCKNTNHPNRSIEDDQDLGEKESNTPEKHGLGNTEKECQVLETIDIVPMISEVGIL